MGIIRFVSYLFHMLVLHDFSRSDPHTDSYNKIRYRDGQPVEVGDLFVVPIGEFPTGPFTVDEIYLTSIKAKETGITWNPQYCVFLKKEG